MTKPNPTKNPAKPKTGKRVPTLRKFKQFLDDMCWDEKKYGNGKYDKMIYEYLTPKR